MRALGLALVVMILAALLVPSGFAARRAHEQRAIAMSMTGGDPHRAKDAMVTYGCAGCHRIPGVAGARGQVGPPLVGIAGRIYIGGSLPNTPENLIRWIMDPPGVNPKTAMPVTGIPEGSARDIAAYLYSP